MESNGVTVHGVAVIGVGVAGTARIKDVKDTTTHGDIQWALKGFVSRRILELDAEQLSMDDALFRSDIDIIIICTENNTHEKIIRQCLEHNKHVLVEFPLALSSNVAKELYGLAEDKGLILHEENVGILNDREQLESLPQTWKTAEITLTAGLGSRGVKDTTKADLPFIANVSLIEIVYHLCGNVKVTGGAYTKFGKGIRAEAKLETDDGRLITVKIEREENNTFKKIMKFQLEDGNEVVLTQLPPVSNKNKVGLYMQDFLIFMEKVHTKKNIEADKARVLNSLEIAENIHQHIMT